MAQVFREGERGQGAAWPQQVIVRGPGPQILRQLLPGLEAGQGIIRAPSIRLIVGFDGLKY